MGKLFRFSVWKLWSDLYSNDSLSIQAGFCFCSRVYKFRCWEKDPCKSCRVNCLQKFEIPSNLHTSTLGVTSAIVSCPRQQNSACQSETQAFDMTIHRRCGTRDVKRSINNTPAAVRNGVAVANVSIIRVSRRSSKLPTKSPEIIILNRFVPMTSDFC